MFISSSLIYFTGAITLLNPFGTFAPVGLFPLLTSKIDVAGSNRIVFKYFKIYNLCFIIVIK